MSVESRYEFWSRDYWVIQAAEGPSFLVCIAQQPILTKSNRIKKCVLDRVSRLAARLGTSLDRESLSMASKVLKRSFWSFLAYLRWLVPFSTLHTAHSIRQHSHHPLSLANNTTNTREDHISTHHLTRTTSIPRRQSSTNICLLKLAKNTTAVTAPKLSTSQ